MLFRPLKPWRVFGIRLPLTPGIIPAKRHELATRMGEMVGSHLLTSADVGRVLERDSFRRELKGAVAEKLGGFLDRELGPVESLVPALYRGRFRDLGALLRWQAVSAVFRRRALRLIRASLVSGDNAVYRVLKRLRTRVLPWAELARAGFSPRVFDNMNTPADYEAVRRMTGDGRGTIR